MNASFLFSQMSITSSTSLSASSNNHRSVWMWLSDPNLFDNNKKQVWKRYSDFENEFIEEAFQRKEKEVQLNDYVINLEHNIQHKKDDINEQRPIKREEIDLNKLFREERFCFPDRAILAKSFTEGGYCWKHNFIYQWRIKNETNQQIAFDRNLKAIAEQAAQGILKEGKLLNHEFDAERMANKLRIAKSDEEVLHFTVSLYSAETFLYKLLNTSLRNNDMDKVETLGPFCYLLNDYIEQNQDRPHIRVYRGATLTAEMIEDYKGAIGKEIIWSGFTSTSKDLSVAEIFHGNTLFIISIYPTFNYQSDITSLSYYAIEKEVVLSAPSRLIVDKIEEKAIYQEYFIYLRAQ